MSYPFVTRRLLAVGASALIGAFGATAIAGAATAQESDRFETSVSGEADCSRFGEDNTFEWSIWWTVDNHSENFHATLETVTLAVSPESAAAEVTMNGLLEGMEIEPDSETQGQITLPEETTVTDLALEVTLTWEVNGQTVTHTAGDSVTLTTGCADEVPFLWEWSAICDTAVTIFFVNPFDEQVDLTFQSATGETVEKTFEPRTSEQIQFTYTAGDGVNVTVLRDREPITEILVHADDVDRLCTDEDESSGEGGEETLPVTGSSTALIAGGAVALLGLGAGTFVLARRRRVSFTA